MGSRDEKEVFRVLTGWFFWNQDTLVFGCSTHWGHDLTWSPLLFPGYSIWLQLDSGHVHTHWMFGLICFSSKLSDRRSSWLVTHRQALTLSYIWLASRYISETAPPSGKADWWRQCFLTWIFLLLLNESVKCKAPRAPRGNHPYKKSNIALDSHVLFHLADLTRFFSSPH